MLDNSTNSLEHEIFFKKRHNELSDIFNSFSGIIEVKFKIDAAKEVCRVYFEYLDFFRDYLEPEAKVNIYKIVSGTELVITRTLPIIHEDKSKEIELNAQLAFFTGYTILTEWFKFRKEPFRTLPPNLQKEVDTFTVEHLTWLELLNPEAQYPYFSNAQTWRLLHLLLQAS